MQVIEYSKRRLNIEGTTLIWPYLNRAKGDEGYELFLDNNALLNINWYRKLPNKIKDKAIISADFTLKEQWLSNPEFQKEPLKRIKEFIQPLINEGAVFPENYAENQASFLKNNDAELKAEWMTGYLYLILLFRIFTAKKGDALPEKLLITLRQKEVPRFGGLVILCTLASYLKKNQNIKMLGDTKKAFSYIQSFVAAQPGKKNEVAGDVNYIRNRVGDCSLWLQPLALVQKNYQFKGQMVIVTNDVPLKEFIMGCIPFVLSDDNSRVCVTFDHLRFDSMYSDVINKQVLQNTKWEINRSLVPTVNKTKQNENLYNLKEHVMEKADDFLRSEVEKVWSIWFGDRFS